MTEVVVTGVGAVSPLGQGADALFERWRAGERAPSNGCARCTGFDPHSVLSRKEVRRTDRFTQLAVASADEALGQAGWGPPEDQPYDRFRVACVIGTGIGGVSSIESQLDAYRGRGRTAVSPLLVPRIMGNAAAAAIAMRYGLCGPSASVASACASGADAVAAGARLIRSGEADAAVVGGSESAVSDFIEAAFSSMHAVSPSGVCRPFDARRDGFVLSEGAAALVLERGSLAAERGAPVLGRLRGLGTSSDAVHITAPDPSARAAAQAITAALDDAEMVPEDVDYVNAHGTATVLNDRAETDALKAALGPRADYVPVSSLKSAIGHSLGAAGALEAVVTVMSLRARVAPPTLGYEVPEEGLDLDYVSSGARPLEGGDSAVGISNSFGFGGHNVVLVFDTP